MTFILATLLCVHLLYVEVVIQRGRGKQHVHPTASQFPCRRRGLAAIGDLRPVPQGPPALPSLHMVVVSGNETITQSAKMQASWSKWLYDRVEYSHVCDPGCEKAANSSIKNIVEIGHRDGWMGAQLKFKFGLVYKVRELIMSGGRQPDWWLVKDSDTYVHAERLMTKVQHLNPNDLISVSASDPFKNTPFAPFFGCTGICSGPGWLLSGGLARKLASEHGERWMNLAVEDYSWQIPEVLSWIDGVKTIEMPEMGVVGPMLTPFSVTDFATWHMKPELQIYSLDKAIQYAEEYLSASK